MEKLLSQCADLIREIDPAMDRPIYLVGFDEIRDELFQGPSNAIAWTSRTLDTELSDWLVAQGRWCGKGFAAIIHLDRCGSFQKTIGACLHEYAHYCDWGSAGDFDSPSERIAAVEMLHSWRPLLATAQDDELALPRWVNHGQRFVRACCHLAHRTAYAVESVRPGHLSFGSRYYGSQFTEATWMQSLAAELHSAGSIRDILSTDPPIDFTELFKEATC